MNAKIRASAEEAAETVLQQSWDSQTLPVNPIAIAQRMGIAVYEAQLPGNVSGWIAREKADGPTEIYLDVDDNIRRRRFTCAHEIGHFVRRQDDPTLVFVERRDGRSADGMDEEEIFANSFASALLMPRHTLQTLLRANISPDSIARHLNVSEQSVAYRIDNLRRDGQLQWAQ
ncbi:MAG: ImmA/IrrE family metallo-endopeptidase [Pseudolysinimonas sp.]